MLPNTNNQQGYVLITAMMILMVLTIIGIISTKTTITELMVTGNDKVHKQTFYMADGGSELAQHITYQNILCSTAANGFTATHKIGPAPGTDVAILQGTILVEDLTFANNTGIDTTLIDNDTRSAAYYPSTKLDDNQSHTNFYTTASSSLLQGSGAQMISGYESLGAGAPGGGSALRYQIASQHHGSSESQSLVQVRWRLDTYVARSASTFDCIY